MDENKKLHDTLDSLGHTVLVVRERSMPRTAEKLLLASVLRRAAYDLALYKGDRRLAARTLWRQAKLWIFEDDVDKLKSPLDKMMSFRNICMILNRDPEDMRRKITALTKKDVRKYDMIDSHG